MLIFLVKFSKWRVCVCVCVSVCSVLFRPEDLMFDSRLSSEMSTDLKLQRLHSDIKIALKIDNPVSCAECPVVVLGPIFQWVTQYQLSVYSPSRGFLRSVKVVLWINLVVFAPCALELRSACEALRDAHSSHWSYSWIPTCSNWSMETLQQWESRVRCFYQDKSHSTSELLGTHTKVLMFGDRLLFMFAGEHQTDDTSHTTFRAQSPNHVVERKQR